MSKLTWDKTGERKYETGVDHGVIYPVIDGEYGAGSAWNGLTAVTESPSGAEASAVYADNMKYLSLMSAEEFGATIEAYTYPEAFDRCNGTAEITKGVTIGQQNRDTFGFSYRTLIGNDVKSNDYGYKIHIIYGAKASPSEKGFQTVNDSPEAISFSWELSTTPVTVDGFKPTAHLEIDSTKVEATKMKKIEDALYGTESTEAKLLLPDEIINLFKITDPSLDVSATPITGEDDLFGKKAADLQSNIKVNESTGVISGTLNYVTGYTGFSSKVDEQSGNYIALDIAPKSGFPESLTVEVKGGTSGPSKLLQSDHQAVLKIKDANKQSILIKATNNGVTETKEYALTGVTLKTK